MPLNVCNVMPVIVLLFIFFIFQRIRLVFFINIERHELEVIYKLYKSMEKQIDRRTETIG